MKIAKLVMFWTKRARFGEFFLDAKRLSELFMRCELSRSTKLFQIELRLANWSY